MVAPITVKGVNMEDTAVRGPRYTDSVLCLSAQTPFSGRIGSYDLDRHAGDAPINNSSRILFNEMLPQELYLLRLPLHPQQQHQRSQSAVFKVPVHLPSQCAVTTTMELSSTVFVKMATQYHQVRVSPNSLIISPNSSITVFYPIMDV